MSGVGITWSESLKFEPALAACSGASWGITASADVREGDLLAQIPKAAVLSVSNTSLADVLAKEGIRGGLGLTIAVLHEYTMGEKSRWYAAMFPGFMLVHERNFGWLFQTHV
jgi:SET domain-containing protein 6